MVRVTPINTNYGAIYGPLRRLTDGTEIASYYPPVTYRTYGAGIDHPLSDGPGFDIERSTVDFIQQQLNAEGSTIQFQFRNSHSSDIAHHAYVDQVHNGIPVSNSVANVAFNLAKKVVAYGSSFVALESNDIASPSPTIRLQEAIKTAEDMLDGTFNEHPAKLGYLAQEDRSAVLTHIIQIRNKATRTWLEAFVDAHSGELVSITNFVSHAAYRVLPIERQVPDDGFQFINNPANGIASPRGWHSVQHGPGSTDTSGNNAVVSHNAVTTPESAGGLVFNYPQNPNAAPAAEANVNAARVNAFYIVNTMHDIAYLYGFTETAFNFQQSNRGLGGAENDRVTVRVQVDTGVDLNAAFSTPQDGVSGELDLFLSTLMGPPLDVSFANDLIVHEFTHGITNRMTGGGTAGGLQTLEALGLGEGWSDAMALWTERIDDTFPDYRFGRYIMNVGMRTAPYSTNAQTNTLRYANVADRIGNEHQTGEVWANMLYNVYAALVGQGPAARFSPIARTNPTGNDGNVVFLHLFIDALLLQPAQPTFAIARDAWIQADVNRYEGYHVDILWATFASRGLGVGANDYVDNNAVPGA